MLKANVYNLEGEVVNEQALRADIFDVQVNPVVVQQVVTALRANARKPWAHTKGRSDVRGGGKKPWKQKGTGRARHGSIRSPLWRGGGVTFGPSKLRNYAKSINKKMKQAALKMVLSDKVKSEQLILVDKLALSEVKTKTLATALGKLPTNKRAILLIVDKNAEHIALSARNLPNVEVTSVHSVNIIDLLAAKSVVIAAPTLETLYSIHAPQQA